MSEQSTKRMPSPLYAAAGAGDLAYEKLRALPEKMSGLRDKVHELRPVGKVPLPERRDVRADLQKLRAVARRNADVLLHTAHVAQERATVVYKDLVARGEHVVHPERSDQRDEPKSADAAEITPAVALEIEPVEPAKDGGEVEAAAVAPDQPAAASDK